MKSAFSAVSTWIRPYGGVCNNFVNMVIITPSIFRVAIINYNVYIVNSIGYKLVTTNFPLKKYFSFADWWSVPDRA